MTAEFRILLIDNYDSYTYNLYHYFRQITDCEIVVIRYDELNQTTPEDFSHIVISPGPGLPDEYPLIHEFLIEYQDQKQFLGICLGLQCMVTALGGKLANLKKVMHGVATTVDIIDHQFEFDGLPNQIEVGHYHSWVAEESTLPNVFTITSKNEDGFIMSIRNIKGNMCGIQFHPESIMTPEGLKILSNWWDNSIKSA